MASYTISASLDSLEQVTSYLRQHIALDAIIFLTGDLAAGKTTLSSAIAKSKGITEGVTSPTFSLQQCYGKGLYHYDLYRITNEEFFEMGLHEELDKSGWHLIEWADEKLQSFLTNAGYNTASITITPVGSHRDYHIEV
jgi:tRNA threonylcarbamoyladenosine biosynthesis protein TsaE